LRNDWFQPLTRLLPLDPRIILDVYSSDITLSHVNIFVCIACPFHVARKTAVCCKSLFHECPL